MTLASKFHIIISRAGENHPNTRSFQRNLQFLGRISSVEVAHFRCISSHNLHIYIYSKYISIYLYIIYSLYIQTECQTYTQWSFPYLVPTSSAWARTSSTTGRWSSGKDPSNFPLLFNGLVHLLGPHTPTQYLMDQWTLMDNLTPLDHSVGSYKSLMDSRNFSTH